jgi:hypothetical protein
MTCFETRRFAPLLSMTCFETRRFAPLLSMTNLSATNNARHPEEPRRGVSKDARRFMQWPPDGGSLSFAAKHRGSDLRGAPDNRVIAVSAPQP